MTTSLRTTFLRGHTEKQMVKVIRRVVARGSFKRFRFVAPMCIHKEAYDSLGPHEWVFQAAFRSVQPCLLGSLVCLTHTDTQITGRANDSEQVR